ncbi:phage major capsid protein [Bacillus wiedmannii]|uniref:phage major capsid protein n=1 Tax=Bacillus wiedmannii TaxID=1890302 RepID=UPI000BFD273D|nr:phage major capsid protein [Bacillus wiedmannii]PHE70496.1 phage major capsid protein [Bacillus wiedmannii]
MNLKALKEKRNELLSKADELINGAEKEVRSLNDGEKTEFESLTSEAEQLNKQISELEENRANGEKIEENTEERNMKNVKELEVRGLEQYLRKQDGEEVRALQTTAQGGAVIPENVEGTIVLKMEESSPVFARARKFPSVAGNLKIAKETSGTVAGFVGEGADVLEGQISFDEVKLNQKRVGAAISLSNQLINDVAVPVVDYSINLLSRRAGKAVEKSILTGNTADEFRGIIHDAEIAAVTAEGALGIDQLMDVYNAIHPEFLDNSSFIMQRKFFNQVAKLKDGNNHFYMQNGVVNGKLTYTLFGAEVIVTDALTDATPLIFGNVSEAYGVMIKKGFALQHVAGDTTQALRGSQLLVLDGYMDGAVFNPQALALLKIKAGA